ncbi:hypothetical protein PM082_015948 [Marasmius tenuissimus]|nr:hypothetical protein PM082_015948 [Marasmius tenuissimus]
MFATFITVALFAAASVRNVAGYTLSTPQMTQCQDVTINVDGAKGSWNLIAVPAADTCNGNILADIGDHDGNSVSWKVALPAGTKVVLTTIDGDEQEAWSGEITVGPSDDTSCIPEQLLQDLTSSSASSSAAASTSAASSSSVAGDGTLVVPASPASTSAYSSQATTTPIGGPVGGVASGPGSSNSNGASRQMTSSMLVLGAISIVLAACL